MSIPKAETLYDVLKYRAETQPDAPAFVFLENGEDEKHPLTYRSLHEASVEFAAHLQSLNMKGERALLIFESDYDYIVSFFACIYAGVISVPLHPPGKNKSMSRISAIASDSGAKLILSTSGIHGELRQESDKDPVLGNIRWICIDETSGSMSGKWTEPEISGDSITYLQYTSGSTGIPKGVIVTHSNLITNLTIIDNSHPHDDNSVMVTWLPIHHDMGLIYGMLLPFFCGYPCYFMTPQAFVQKPVRWLNAITKYRGTHNAAPNFAFELCVNKVTEEDRKHLDLGSWTVAMNAAEPVRAETLTRFAGYFSDCGFRFDSFKPGYGLAEGTLILSTVFKNSRARMVRFDDADLEKNNMAREAGPDDSISKVHVGHAHSIDDTRIAIVDPVAMLECPEGRVGEVWAKGKSIAGGYWQRKDATLETFQAVIKDTGEGPFLRTGDLGFIKDNELYITGRHKDLIIVRGQNHYPQDIEYTVEAAHPALRLGCVAAFPVEAEGEERIGIVQEIQKNFESDFDSEEIFRAIRSAVSNEHDLQVHSITLIKAQTIPKTSSGKIQRRACKEGFINGGLAKLAEWIQSPASDEPDQAVKYTASFEDVKQFLLTRFARMMQIRQDSIDPAEPFASYGMDSLKAVQLSGELEEFLHAELPATLVYDYPSVNALAGFLSGKKASGTTSPVKRDHAKEGIAIVGIGLRFPGGNNSPDKFHQFLLNGGDAIRPVPEGRWPEDLMKKNTVRLGGFLDEVDMFDPLFYGISPREALQMDPQQRLALEVAWEALEDACIDPSSLAGVNAGVFMGVCTYDYSRFSSGRKNIYDVYTGTGTSLSIVANRISYLLDLRGPSIAIDTACSSSLVALHTACRSLNSGESSVALAGGVNLLLTPDWNVVFTEADMLAPDGHCKTFDSSADGYVRSEGCGVVVLKRLSDALNDGDRIYAVISGSAINQDGKSNGLTAPNGPSQVEVIRAALNDAGISGDDIGYVEAHGTGTPLGDPIEVNSITEALNVRDRKTEPLRIGSVKTNIGHLEAAAGIAGVIKTSLALHSGVLPAQINFRTLNPEILMEGFKAEVATANTGTKGRLKYAGVSSFGFGGTNAHVVLSPAPELVSADSSSRRPNEVLMLSAKNEKSLNDLASSYLRFIENNPALRLEDLTFSANTGREIMSHRLAISCEGTDDLQRALRHYADPDAITNIFAGQAKPGKKPSTVFLFPGQGAQYSGMGKELYDTVPLFRDTINKCNEVLKSYLPVELLQVVFSESPDSLSALDMTRYTQPALFSIEYALGKLWMSWGIVPDVMMGHSAGEYVAACLAGVFSLEDGLKLVAERGRLMEEMTSAGEMFTVFADEHTTKSFLKGYEDKVSIASINSPVKTVISGYKDAVNAVIKRVEEKGIEYKKINVSIASHSPVMKSMIDEFEKVCRSVSYSKASIPVVSNITAEITSDKIANARYWCDHIMSGVRYSDSILACVERGCTHFIDLGPKPTSLSMAQETVQSPELRWIPSFKKNYTSWQTLSEGLAQMFVDGAGVNMKGYHSGFAGRKISLPTYPFHRQRYWIADQISSADASLGSGISTGKAMLGSKVNTASEKTFIYNTVFSANDPAFLSGHKVFGKTVFPGAGYAELALSAASEAFGTESVRLENLKLRSPLFLEDERHATVQTVVTLTGKRKAKAEIFLLEESSNWKLLANADIKAIDEEKTVRKPEPEGMPADVSVFYDSAAKSGIGYSGDFAGLLELNVSDRTAVAKAGLSGASETDGYVLHPALLDLAFQAALSVLYRVRRAVYVPASVDSISRFRSSGNEVNIEAVRQGGKDRQGADKFDITLTDNEGAVCAAVKGLRLSEVTRKEFTGEEDDSADIFYDLTWKQTEESSRSVTAFSKFSFTKTSGKADRVFKNTDDKALENYLAAVRRLDRLVCRYILQGISDLEFTALPGCEFDAEVFVSNAGKHGKLARRLLEILRENDAIGEVKGKTVFTDKAAELLETTSEPADYSGSEHEYEFVKQCGEKLSDVLAGRKDSLDVLFPEGDFTKAGNIYALSPGFSVMNAAIARQVSALTQSQKKGRKLRILELGAGTGSTTASVLNSLRRNKCEYLFTDVSSAFFEKARERFADRDFIEYKTLDIERDPVSQGFAPESFDVIIASNVLHATKDLAQTLSNAKLLLRKDGVILLNEASGKKAWIDLTFGMTDGWWRFEDTALRRDHPLLNGDQWTALLEECGFGDTSVLTVSDEDLNSYSGQHLITSFRKADEEGTVNIFLSRYALSPDDHLSLLEAAGRNVFVTDSVSFEEVSENSFEADLNSEDQLRDVLKTVSAGKGPKMNIAYIAFEKNNEGPREPYEEAIDHCVKISNIIRASLEYRPALTVITSDSQFVSRDDKVTGFAASALWGFMKVAGLEHPEIVPKIVDVDAKASLGQAFTETIASPSARFTAFRGSVRFEAQIVPARAKADHGFVPKKHFAYLITGGLSGIGLLTARVLANAGARNIILAGRRGATPEADMLKHQLSETGVNVLIIKADVTDEKDIENIFSTAKDLKLKIKGIVHSAGVLDDAVISNMSPEKIRRVMEPKAKAAWLLHRKTLKSGLQFFLMYSSVASLLGSAGQSNHSSANAFLDSLAVYIKSLGLHAMSLNWGVWAEIGSAVEKGADKQEKIAGIIPLTPEEGMDALSRVFDADFGRLGILKMDWTRYNSVHDNPMTAGLSAQASEDASRKSRKSEKESLSEKLTAATEQDQFGLLQDYFRKLISRIMGLEPEDIEPDIPLSSMGLDSLMAIELKNRVNMELGVDLNLVRYMEETDINQLSRELRDQIPKMLGKKDGQKSEAAKEISEEEKARELLTGLENLSEEELDKLLKEMN